MYSKLTHKEWLLIVHSTRNDLNQNARNMSIELLNTRLADAIDLSLVAKQAHWNVKGPQFIAVHEMLDRFRADLDMHVDTIAERAVQLGGTALGTTQIVAERTPLKPYPTDIFKTKDHLAALIDCYALAATKAREAIAEAEEAGDMGTADIFTAYSQALDKSLWFLEAHTQESE
ncbi:DNA starvation/stationary phase protection protein Dps [Pseudaminobacter arsenicus]|uniref:DNA starvation/stationary phase protection protein Dps n=1 Tax=Borborobacter arsenicus TaxID=1851146 RepID=A0A432V7P8_9HYPH|nr:DNA starvation/stationary phase protection protein Dps [Pseudaminobacter arsenicus]RUM98184.1 DNA starvation/stationary phase protection protein Dps [Pseudaminobacter arsenicus]